ncbi:hypothetical protein ACFXI3_19790, partial [Amycolatopsis sp. NPDC059235]|uniref:hypothetical protein n=1 Tax=Amycolatopsis sp. NPDC059235 TaxID=3346782 RepID=UPI00367201D1
MGSAVDHDVAVRGDYACRDRRGEGILAGIYGAVFDGAVFDGVGFAAAGGIAFKSTCGGAVHPARGAVRT